MERLRLENQEQTSVLQVFQSLHSEPCLDALSVFFFFTLKPRVE